MTTDRFTIGAWWETVVDMSGRMANVQLRINREWRDDVEVVAVAFGQDPHFYTVAELKFSRLWRYVGRARHP